MEIRPAESAFQLYSFECAPSDVLDDTRTARRHRLDLGRPFRHQTRRPRGCINRYAETATGIIRYDKLAANYLAFIQIASIGLRLRINVPAC